MGAEKGFGVDGGYVIGGYVIGPKTSTCAVIVVPNELGWRAPGVRRVLDRFADSLAAEHPVIVCCPDVHRGNTWLQRRAVDDDDGGGDSEAERAAGDAAAAASGRWDEWITSHPAERVARDVADVASALKEGGASKVFVVGSGWHPSIAAALVEKSSSEAAAAVQAFAYSRLSSLEALLALLGAPERDASGAGRAAAGADGDETAALAEFRECVMSP